MTGQALERRGMGVALAPGDVIDEREWAHMERVAAVLAKSNLVPEHFRGKPADVMVAGLGLRDLGVALDPNTLGMCYVVKGKPGYMAQLQIGLARRHGIDVRYEPEDCTHESATVEIRDRTGWHRVTFTMADAVRAGLTRQNQTYGTYPDRMLIARAITKAIGFYCPGVKLGIFDPALDDNAETGEIAPEGPTASLGALPAGDRPPFDPSLATTLELELLQSLLTRLDDATLIAVRAAAKAAGIPRLTGGQFTSDHGAQLLQLAGEARIEQTAAPAGKEADGAEGAGGAVEAPPATNPEDDGRPFE